MNGNPKTADGGVRGRLRAWPWMLAAVAWTVLLFCLGWLGIEKDRGEMMNLPLTEARANIEKDLAFRRWAASHGGVYVKPTEKTPPNPYLAHLPHRDVVTSEGVRLTLMNPAYMTRQVHELTAETFGYKGHITSLNPIRPENAPDKWETAALRKFQEGAGEFYELLDASGEPSFRYMRRLVTEKSCLTCHAAQGYREGDVRGGISVTLPMAPYLEVYNAEVRRILTYIAGFWIAGLFALYLVRRVVASQYGRLGETLGMVSASETRFAAAFHGSPMMKAINDVESGEFIEVNERFTAFTGYSREECLGRTPQELGIHSGGELRRIAGEISAGGRADIPEVVIAARDGRRAVCRYIGIRVTMDGRERVISTLENVTKARKIDEMLHYLAESHHGADSGEFFRGLAEKLAKILEMDYVCVDELKSGNLEASTLAQYYLGSFMPDITYVLKDTPCGEVVDQSICCIDRGVRALYPNDKPLQELKAESYVGSLLWNSRGEPIGLLAVIGIKPLTERDLAVSVVRMAAVRAGAELEHKKDMDALAAEKARLAEAQRAAQLGNWEHDLKTGVFTWSDEVGSILEIGPETSAPSLAALVAAIHPADREAFMAAHRSALEARTPVEIMHRLLMPGGEVKHATSRISGVFDGEGNPEIVFGSVQDVTRLYELESRLAQSQKVEAVGRLAGGVAHDFNNMLGVIIGNAELALQAVSPSDPVREELEQIVGAARRSADITRQLLAFARKQSAAPRVIGLNDTIRQTVKMLERLIGEDVRLTFKPGLNLWNVLMDPVQVDQLLTNLCANARDAIAGVGQVTIETCNRTVDASSVKSGTGAEPGDYVVVEVSDDGEGIPPDLMSRIFDPFFTTKSTGRGTGLGLATVDGIVRQNRGFIEVESARGKGTTFRVHIPRALAVPDEAGTVETRPGGGGETVMIVEDEAANLKLGQKFLKSLGYRVIAASSPLEAVDKAKNYQERIDLLLTDVVMPEMNGRDLAEAVKLAQPGIKCIFMSGYADNIIAERGLLTEEVNFIGKPYRLDDLAAKIRSVLDSD